ncbi:Uncharacterised protein [Chlamydia trachomatis]|nr:Uncharacterised protein [Chlamydia trachomatis]CRH48648.1 Uncharacterised protein [Chlamydia trachomatis]
MSPSRVTTIYLFSNNKDNLLAFSIVSVTKIFPNKNLFKISNSRAVETNSEATPKNPF